MDVYKEIIHKSKKFIDSYFGISQKEGRRRRKEARGGPHINSFKVTELIYTEERDQFMQEAKFMSAQRGAKAPYRHVRVRKSFAKNYAHRRPPVQTEQSTPSPVKYASVNQSLVCSSPDSPDIQCHRGHASTSFSSSSRGLSLPRNSRSFHLHNIMDICDRVRGKPKVVAEVRRQQSQERQLQSYIARTEETLEEINSSPCEVLEPLFKLKREADSFLKQDAAQMVRDERDNVDESASQVKIMIARSTQFKRTASSHS